MHWGNLKVTEYQIRVGPTEIVIRSDESPEHIEAVQALVQQSLHEAGADSGRGQYMALSFAALSLADKLLKEKASHSALKERIRSRSRDLLRTLAARSLDTFSVNDQQSSAEASLVA
jgi:cell division protein ZapA (FtsZ GTPase activity inhibitor)